MNGSNDVYVRYLIVGLVVIAVLLVLYFLPSIIASKRNHSNAVSIALLNLFLGWTFLGWIGALIWAFSDNTREPAAVQRSETSAPVIWGVVGLWTAIAVVAVFFVTERARPAEITQAATLAAASTPQVSQKESPSSAIIEGFTQNGVDPDSEAYRNSRYGFQIDYPESFKPDGEPENGDGLTLKSADGKATLVVSGMNNSGVTLQDEFDRSTKEVQGQLGFNKMGGSWFVVSWADGENLGYTKEFVGAGSQNSFTITFPSDQKGQYDSIVTKIEKSFKPGDLASSH